MREPVWCPLCKKDQPIVAMGPETVHLACGADHYIDGMGYEWYTFKSHD